VQNNTVLFRALPVSDRFGDVLILQPNFRDKIFKKFDPFVAELGSLLLVDCSDVSVRASQNPRKPLVFISIV
jgi:hypothetical protein